MDIGTILIWVLVVILAAVALWRGTETFTAGLWGGWAAGKSLTPLLIGVLLLIGFSNQLLPKEMVAELLGGGSGWKGILLACGLGAITPGGPFVSYPLVATLYQSGAGIGPIVAFVTAWSLWSVSRLPLEISLVGPQLTLLRVCSSLLFPPIAGFLAQGLVRWLPFTL